MIGCWPCMIVHGAWSTIVLGGSMTALNVNEVDYQVSKNHRSILNPLDGEQPLRFVRVGQLSAWVVVHHHALGDQQPPHLMMQTDEHGTAIEIGHEKRSSWNAHGMLSVTTVNCANVCNHVRADEQGDALA